MGVRFVPGSKFVGLIGRNLNAEETGRTLLQLSPSAKARKAQGAPLGNPSDTSRAAALGREA